MERLTERRSDRRIVIKGCATLYPSVERESAPASNAIVRLAAYEDTGLEPEGVETQSIALKQCKPYIDAICDEHGKLPINPIRLAELAQAEKDGRLVVLPCKPGDDLMRNGLAFKGDHWNVLLTAFADDASAPLGKRAKLFSPEEAEAALKKREEAT